MERPQLLVVQSQMALMFSALEAEFGSLTRHRLATEGHDPWSHWRRWVDMVGAEKTTQRQWIGELQAEEEHQVVTKKAPLLDSENTDK